MASALTSSVTRHHLVFHNFLNNKNEIMKKIFITIIALTLLLSCNKKDKAIPKSITVAAIVDITDPLVLYPNPDAILRLYGFDKEKNTEAFFRLCLITDRQINTTEDFHLGNGITTEADNKIDDPQFRQKLILAYYKTIRKSITDFTVINRKDSSLRYSECFKNITRQLSEMKQKHATENTLLIFSDLQENTEFFSNYAKQGKDLLYNHSEKLVAIFDKTKLLPDDLKGFNIFFLFQPKNRNEDKAYVAMTTIYKSLLEKRNARVTITASNKNYIQ
jgi:hypothetical protein